MASFININRFVVSLKCRFTPTNHSGKEEIFTIYTMHLPLTSVATANQVGKVGESFIAVVALAAAEEDLRVFLHGDALLPKNNRWRINVTVLDPTDKNIFWYYYWLLKFSSVSLWFSCICCILTLRQRNLIIGSDIATDYLMHIFAWLLVLVSTNIRQERLHL